MATSLTAAPFHWIRSPADASTPLHARIRHRQALQECRLLAHDGDRIEVAFTAPQRAAVAGQYLVVYDGEECLGGGEIGGVRTLA